MCLLIESIKIFDGKACNLACHNRRMNAARKSLFNLSAPIHLEEHLKIPEYARYGLFKCRVLYSRYIEHMEYHLYKQRSVQTLKIVHDDHIDYRYKYADRSALEKLFAQRANCDDILIIKKGRVTDTSYSNIIFFDGSQWFTPLYPLLEGTQRQKLLDEQKIQAADILEKDIAGFTYFKVINALNAFEAHTAASTQHIFV